MVQEKEEKRHRLVEENLTEDREGEEKVPPCSRNTRWGEGGRADAGKPATALHNREGRKKKGEKEDGIYRGWNFRKEKEGSLLLSESEEKGVPKKKKKTRNQFVIGRGSRKKKEGAFTVAERESSMARLYAAEEEGKRKEPGPPRRGRRKG